MKILAICRPRAGADQARFAALVPAETEALRALRDDGVLLEAYSPGAPGAVLVLETGSEPADEVLGRLPLAAAGLLAIETIDLHPIQL